MSSEPEAHGPRRARRGEPDSAAESPTDSDDSTGDAPAVEEPAADEPAVNEPAADEPAVNEPAADAPAMDEPAADAPAVNEPADTRVDQPADSPATPPTPPTPADEGADEDSPQPLYRDETTPEGSTARADQPEPRDSSDETTILGRARERKRHAQSDPDATTMLPRTASGGRVRRRDSDDLDDDFETDPRVDRRRLLLMIGAVAMVAILGLVAGYAIIRTVSAPVAAPGPTTSGETDPGAAPSEESSDASGTALITDAMMLSVKQAETLDSKRTWQVALTQRGTSPDSPHPACLSADPGEGAPIHQQTVLQVLSSSGSDAPAALHQAESYGTPEEAAQAYAYASRALGDCAMAGAWIYQGHQIAGVGDQATAVTIQVLDGPDTEYRTVVLARTGRIVDVIDVAKPDRPVTAKRVATVAGAVVDTQCQAAGGACSDEPEAQDGPPPLGGDQPGFLASGDLPPMGAELTRWGGTTPGEPDPDALRGSGCETVDWSKVDAESRSHRTYLLSDSGSTFGLDEVVVTTKDEAAARKLAEKVRDDWKDCRERQLTATVSGIHDVAGSGAKGIDVSGWTTEVTHKAAEATSKYRVGVVAAGTKVAFVLLNPQQDLDLTTEQFDIVTVRAGQRATQVN